MLVCPRHPAVVAEPSADGWRCFVCEAAVSPREVEEPSTLPFGAKPNLELYDRAIRELEAALARSPRDVRLLQRLAEVHLKKQQAPQAAAYLARLADAYEAGGELLQALAVLKQVLRLRPDDAGVRLKLARLFEELGLAADAVAQLEAALHARAEPALLEKVRAELARLRRR